MSKTKLAEKKELPAEIKPEWPEQLTLEVRKKIFGKMSSGARPLTAFRAAGIKDRTYYDWRQKAALQQEPLAAFFLDLARAEAELEIKLVKLIIEAAEQKKDWVPAMTFLERRYPELYGKRPVETGKQQPLMIQIVHNRGGKPGEEKEKVTTEIAIGLDGIIDNRNGA
jgi:hypothetical protein